MKENPRIGPTEVAAAVSKQVGKTVSPTYVSNIKSISNGKPTTKSRRGRKPARVAATGRSHKNGSVDLVTIVALKDLVGRIGATTAKQLIELLV